MTCRDKSYRASTVPCCRVPAQRCAGLLGDFLRAHRWSLVEVGRCLGYSEMPLRSQVGRLCQFPWFGGWLLIVNAITKWLRSYNESVVFGEIANAPRHTSVVQRRRTPPTNTQLHNMQRLSSVQLLGGPNKLHFPNLTPSVPVLRVFVHSDPKTFLDHLQHPIHLEGLISGVKWHVSPWVRALMEANLRGSAALCFDVKIPNIALWRWRTLARVLETSLPARR